MNSIRAAVLGTCLIGLLGCTRVHHRFEPFQAVGEPLAIEVSITHSPDELVTGTVHHRAPGEAAYRHTPMQVRGQQLWAMLPTDQLRPDDTIEYYLDVSKNGKLITLGSPARPYAVKVLDDAGMVRANIRAYTVASDTNNPVGIILAANRQPIDQPTAMYRMPGVPGDIRAPMETDGRGNYHVFVPPPGVRAGTWHYAIEIPYRGQIFRVPRQGFRSFVVIDAAYEPKRTADATD